MFTLAFCSVSPFKSTSYLNDFNLINAITSKIFPLDLMFPVALHDSLQQEVMLLPAFVYLSVCVKGNRSQTCENKLLLTKYGHPLLTL